MKAKSSLPLCATSWPDANAPKATPSSQQIDRFAHQSARLSPNPRGVLTLVCLPAPARLLCLQLLLVLVDPSVESDHHRVCRRCEIHGRGRERNLRAYRRSVRPGFQLELAARQLHALLHAAQPKTALRGPQVEAAAVIRHCEVQPLVADDQLYLHFIRMGVPTRVVQRLLRHAIYTQCDVDRKSVV